MLRSCSVSCVWGCVEHGVLCAPWWCWHTDSKGQTSPSLRGSRRWLCHISVSISSKGRCFIVNKLLCNSEGEIFAWGGDPREGQRLELELSTLL